MTEEKKPWDDESWRRDPKNWDFDNLKNGKTIWGEPVDREGEEYKANAAIGECLLASSDLRMSQKTLHEAEESKITKILERQDRLVQKLVDLTDKLKRTDSNRRLIGAILLQLSDVKETKLKLMNNDNE
jgi:hypothetical protein